MAMCMGHIQGQVPTPQTVQSRVLQGRMYPSTRACHAQLEHAALEAMLSIAALAWQGTCV